MMRETTLPTIPQQIPPRQGSRKINQDKEGYIMEL